MSVNPLLRVGTAAVATLGVLALSACGSDPEPSGSSSPGGSSSSTGADCPQGTLNAEGSSAQKNAIEEVISKYNEKCADVTVNYNPTGSGAGIKQFIAAQVDFAGSDSALKTEGKDGAEPETTQAQKRCGGNPALNLPMVIGPIAIAYNLDGVAKLVLDGPTAAKIFQGAIKTWNDPAIAKLNAGVTLWTGTGAGKEKSAGVAEGVKSTKNSITYVEMSYAVDNKLGVAQIDNGSGTPVELTADSAGKALAAAKIKGTGNDLAMSIDYTTKEAGAYPIILVTYEIACSKGLPAEKTALVKSFLSYFVSKDGQGALTALNYGPLPEEIRTKVDAAIQSIS